MTAKIISFGIQKGGSSKTTTSGVVAHLLSQAAKVLVIDIGSLTLIGVIGMAAYRTYELRKLKKAMEEQVIDIEPEKVEEVE